jgi:SARP family transcriptional regulator, regulator of embCAB operon
MLQKVRDGAEAHHEVISMRIYLTGRVCIEAGETVLDERHLVGRQGRLVFALLACEHHRAVSRDELAEELWPAALPPSWDRALSAIVSKLRSALTRVGLSGTTIVSSFGSYQLHLPPAVWIDLEAAAEALDQAESLLRDGKPRDAWAWALVAYHIAGRPCLVGEDGPWATLKRLELRDMLVRALDCLSEIYSRNGENSLAARRAEQALILEPFRETSYQRLMQAHAAAGNKAEALRVYERCRRLLAEELGVSPSSQTEAVYLDVLSS